MDASEATQIVMSRIQSLDPENASRIMGVILIQDQGEKEMIRLAFGSEAVLLTYVNKAKAVLGIPSSSPTGNPSAPLSISLGSNCPFPQTSPRILVPNNGFHLNNPSSPAGSFPRSSPRPISYAAVVNGSNAGATTASNGSGSPSLHFYGGNDFGDEILSAGGGGVHNQVQDQLLFVDDPLVDPIMSPSGRSDSLIYPFGEDMSSVPSPHSNPFHRRSCSVNDASFLANLEEGGGGSGFGWRPCMYFARGFCKNGSTCKFLHSDVGGGEAVEVGSPGQNVSGFDEFLRMKALQQQKFALMASGAHYPFAYNKGMNFLSENQRSAAAAAAALMMGDEFHKFSRCRLERNEFAPMGLGAGSNSNSRQIYLTFPADSTFKEEDVSNYFSMFGPVQDVRIPYQQKRMFGFVTFVFPETVKLILAKGNPHFVCDSRVLVKPYKEKGRVSDKNKHQHMEMGDYTSCLSPTELDSRDHFDVPFGMTKDVTEFPRNYAQKKIGAGDRVTACCGTPRKKNDEFTTNGPKNQHHGNRFVPNLPSGLPISSPRQSQMLINHNLIISSGANNQDVSGDFDSGHEAAKTRTGTDGDFNLAEQTESLSNNNVDSVTKKEHTKSDHSDPSESFGYSLPDNLFSSPTKFAAENQSAYFPAFNEADDNIHVTNTSSNIPPVLPNSSQRSHATFKCQGVRADQGIGKQDQP
ncbi:zinc finger CCCH domain-containing protein 22 [Dorcoceras hygrometricum]|uniref:Zinc finger CCCH domain-containing protein 22 n=1 Tax=Dorcoceras hygrometricum TaxID=472368 RepID=A0A2Z7C4Q8_9LAMI|nr:zinc finger CCCH domain-containing protein 22 [Dorcoceras hygrometricum]